MSAKLWRHKKKVDVELSAQEIQSVWRSDQLGEDAGLRNMS